MPNSLLTSPQELKVLLVGPDTFIVNYRFADEKGTLTKRTMPDHLVEQLDDWKKQARKESEPVQTDLVFSYQVGETRSIQPLFIRSHGEEMWPWLLFCDDLKLKIASGAFNKGLFCQARFSSHLLWTIGPWCAVTELDETLYSFVGDLFDEQASELHLCADIQGFDFSSINIADREHFPFVTRVQVIKDRPVPPTEEEQEGGLPSDKESAAIKALEQKIAQEIADFEQQEYAPLLSVTTNRRRVETLDFGTHASDISAQIYNKTKEMKKHRKDWFEPLYRMHGYDGESEIWRLEFRAKRPFIRERLDLNGAFDTLASIPLIWKYCTEQWLRMIDLDAPRKANISRLPTHYVWERLQRAYDHYEEAMQDQLSPLSALDRETRLHHLLQEKPLETLKQAAALSQYAETEPSFMEQNMLSEEELHTLSTAATAFCAASSLTVARLRLLVLPLCVLAHSHEKQFLSSLRDDQLALEESFRDEPVQLVREVAAEQLAQLPASSIDLLLECLSPSREVVRTELVKRERRATRRDMNIACALGNIRSAVALIPPDELPGYLGPDVPASRRVPDLLASVLWFFEKARDYDRKKGRQHIEEVHKKRVRLGCVDALELEAQRREQGVELEQEDWSAVEKTLEDMRQARRHRGKTPAPPSDDPTVADGFFVLDDDIA